ncbi:MAG: threonine--tRNA ligase [Patescibacteria group bacterium]
MKNTSENAANQIDAVRHSLAHLLAMAVLKKFPKAKLGIGPVIENGFYYDFLIPSPFTPDDLKEFQKEMKKLIGARLPIVGEKVTPLKAKKIFANQPFKLELIKDFVKEKKSLTIYATGEAPSAFTDLCRGGHVKNTSEINPDAFQLTTIAGAYWKGDEKNKQLQRIYGLAFETKKELNDYQTMLEEAKKRDHRKLGQDLDLFTFSELVGSGLPLWTPKGTILRNVLDNLVWSLRKERGYQQVDIPHIAKKDLYEKSGHWDKFKDELMKITTREGHIFAMKPMNCPHHIQIFVRKQHSYRDLPIRFANTTKVYRDEQTGELSGLTRVRSITQDDAHVFCRLSQIKEEMLKAWNIIEIFYGKVGFKLDMRLSFHDPKESKKYLGTPKMWNTAENILRDLAKAKKIKYTEVPGEAAFYGPKIDFIATDSLGREWQVATIQLDMNLPERFDLNCINENGEKERIVMIHVAIMGSIERYLAVLIEHFAGAFPFWLAPAQVAILPINDKNENYIKEIEKILVGKDIRFEIDRRNESVGKKIREAEIQKIPFVIVIGDREAEAKTVALRERGKGDLGAMSIENAIAKMLG